jgi:hypothetical protein
MFLKILGTLDLVSVAGLLLQQYGVFSFRFALIVSLYLMLKGYVFREAWTSYIDMAIGIYLLLMIFGLNHIIITYAFAIYLAQKALVSLFA